MRCAHESKIKLAPILNHICASDTSLYESHSVPCPLTFDRTTGIIEWVIMNTR